MTIEEGALDINELWFNWEPKIKAGERTFFVKELKQKIQGTSNKVEKTKNG